ncbi:hypothetical protein ACQPXH_14790 [Nocardia sp. CA-135953]|uniref:hypothetical protein n=1 Tax=Nocardia sp. CA-135953 TaxID=3239978 RepID=UPI003D982134
MDNANNLNARYIGINVPPGRATFNDRAHRRPEPVHPRRPLRGGRTGKNTNIYMLFDIDNLDEGQAQR